MPTVHVLAEDPARLATLRRRMPADPPVPVVVAAGATVEEALLLCHRDHPRLGDRVVLVADTVTPAAVFRAVRAGVSVILRNEDAHPARLAKAVTAAAAGDGVMPGAEVGRLLDETTSAPTITPLTDREVQMLRLVADGYGNADIARHLKCSPHTVKNTIHDLMTRLRLRNRTHAAAFAVRSGLA